jgi:hypothetical protein
MLILMWAIAALIAVFLLLGWLSPKLTRLRLWLLESDRQVQIMAKKPENKGLSRWGAWKMIWRTVKGTKID